MCVESGEQRGNHEGRRQEIVCEDQGQKLTTKVFEGAMEAEAVKQSHHKDNTAPRNVSGAPQRLPE